MSADRPGIWPEGTGLIRFGTVASTMDEAARIGRPARPTWIAAERQTGARGRGGKPWDSPPGNFAATWLMARDRPPAEAALTSFVAALALYDTLAVYLRPERLALKWPNDVLLDGRKIAGILLESAGARGAEWLAVGIGVNLVAAPPPEALPVGALPAISLAGAGPDFDMPYAPDDVLGHLAIAMDRWMRDWAGAGFEPVRRLWLKRAARLGEPIRVRLPREDLTGLFETVDPDGCLVLAMPDGRRRISAGEVFLG